MHGWRHAVASVVILVVLMGSITLFEGTRVGAYPITYETTFADVLHEDLTLDEGNEHGTTFTAADANLTDVAVRLSWSDDEGAPDEVHLRLVAPNGTEWATSGSSGRLELTARAQAVPAAQTAYAPDARAAALLVPPPATDPAVVGTWRVVVHLVAAPGAPGTIGNGVDDVPDGAESFTLHVSSATFEARVGSPA